VTTNEKELFESVDLCTPDGLLLNRAALGWSRRPLHRANLDGRFGVNKRWDYWAILAGDLVVSTTFADLDHLGLADVYWVDLASGESGGQSIVTGAGDGISLPDVAGATPLHVERGRFFLTIEDHEGWTHLSARWSEPDGREGSFDIAVALPRDHESLNVVIPWSDELFNFTSKHQARSATGALSVGSRNWNIGGQGDAPPGECSTSGVDDGPLGSIGIGAAEPDAAVSTSLAFSSARNGPRARASPKTG